MTHSPKKGTLGDILSASQIITEADIEAALTEQQRCNCRFGEALVNLGIVTQEDIDWALSNQLDLPYIRLKKEMLDPDALALIPAAMARRFNVIPLIRAGNELNVAIADPLNRAAVEAIELQSGCSVNISVALIREIREMIDAGYGSAGEESLGFASPVFSEQVLTAINADLGGGKLLDYLLVFIIQNRLSSLSLQPCGDQIMIVGRRGGITRPVGTLQPNYYPDLVLRLRLAAAMGQIHDISSSGILNFSYRSRTAPFRVMIMQGEGGDYITLRPHVPSSIPERLSELNLPPEQHTSFVGLARAASGISFFASRNREERDRMIDLMLEEMETSGKTVIVFGHGPGRGSKRFPRIPMPSDEASRARLIMDSLDHLPDLLVIEDATEGMPFTAACRAAMRGKRVLAGLEIRGTRNVLRHLLLYQQKNYFLPVFVNGLVSFKGIQLLCPECRCEYQPPDEEREAMRLADSPESFYRSIGCDACGHTGFSGRRFLVDVIPFRDEFLRVFEQSSDVEALDRYLESTAYRGVEHEGLELLMAGQVSPEEYIASVVL